MSNLNKEKIESIYNFREIEKGKLYRSSQPDEKFLSYLEDFYNIRTIVSLRNKIEKSEINFVNKKEISLVHIPLTPLSILSKEKTFTFLKLFSDKKNFPILLHCRRGKDRTGIMTALFRLYYQNWSEKEVFKEINEKKVNLFWKITIKWKWRMIREIKKNENLS